jgi:gluconate kinase
MSDSEYNKKHRAENKEHYKEYKLSYYAKNKERISKVRSAYKEKNRELIREKNKQYRFDHVEVTKNYKMSRRYGLSHEQFINMVNKQNNLCAICNQPEKTFDQRIKMLRRLAIDHNHTTGKVRGLLCLECNSGIGKLKDSIELLTKAINYLKEND